MTESSELVCVNARTVRGSKLVQTGLEVELDSGFIVRGEADILSGFGSLELADQTIQYGYSSGSIANREVIKFRINHGFYTVPNVVIKPCSSANVYTLKQKGLFSGSGLLYHECEVVGELLTSLLSSRCRCSIHQTVPIEVSLTAIWCLMLRGAFSG